jgi:hypothetical protein
MWDSNLKGLRQEPGTPWLPAAGQNQQRLTQLSGVFSFAVGTLTRNCHTVSPVA